MKSADIKNRLCVEGRTYVRSQQRAGESMGRFPGMVTGDTEVDQGEGEEAAVERPVQGSKLEATPGQPGAASTLPCSFTEGFGAGRNVTVSRSPCPSLNK